MSLQQLRTVNFGRNRADATGSNGINYMVFDATGSLISQSSSDVYQVTSGSGIYSAYINFPDNFHGQIFWSTGTAFPTASYAIEEFNVEANNPYVTENNVMLKSAALNIQTLLTVAVGRWKIENNQLFFFNDNSPGVVATFNLLDDKGIPSMSNVFERVPVVEPTIISPV
jgi:hypothetical protein